VERDGTSEAGVPRVLKPEAAESPRLGDADGPHREPQRGSAGAEGRLALEELIDDHHLEVFVLRTKNGSAGRRRGAWGVRGAPRASTGRRRKKERVTLREPIEPASGADRGGQEGRGTGGCRPGRKGGGGADGRAVAAFCLTPTQEIRAMAER